jgi:hypothetical protein
MNSLGVMALTVAEKDPRQAHDSASRDVWIMFPHIEKKCASLWMREVIVPLPSWT